MAISGKDIAKSAAQNTYFGAGFSTKDGMSVGAQSINASDNYGADTDSGYSEKAAKTVSNALEKNRSRTPGTTRTARR